MNDNHRIQHPWPGPFGMGRQGYVVAAIIIVGSALFAASRRDWVSMIVSALLLPLVMFALVHLLSRFWRDGSRHNSRRQGSRQGPDLLTFLSLTNPFMFLLIGAMNRGADDDRNQEILRSGTYGMGANGYLIALIIFLTPLILTLIVAAITGQFPMATHPG